MNYFSEDELRCKCGCGEYKFDDKALDNLNAIRIDFGKPLIVTSGYRCHQHPIEAVKATPGAHTQGKAVDLAVSRGDALELLKIALLHGVHRIGVNQKGSGRFIHLDWSTDLPSPAIWSY